MTKLSYVLETTIPNGDTSFEVQIAFYPEQVRKFGVTTLRNGKSQRAERFFAVLSEATGEVQDRVADINDAARRAGRGLQPVAHVAAFYKNEALKNAGDSRAFYSIMDTARSYEALQ